MPYGETNPKNIFIGLIFGVIILMLGIGFFSFAMTQNPTAGTGFDAEAFNNSVNYMTDMQSKINETQSSLQYASSENVGILGSAGALIQAAWTSIKSMFSAIGYTSKFLAGITDILHIPAYITGLLVSVIIIIIVVWIVLLVFRRT